MSTAPAPQAGRWYAACLYAAGSAWAVVQDVAQPGTVPGRPGLYQMQAAPGRYATQEAATAAAARFNAPRLRPADRYGELPTPAEDYHPHPWDLK